ncbi:hypothetical protein GCM10027160_23490 [Streptomyces calidiresistens]|uniref:Uncharacterized protein n=1 Tax=Streptomyces calidiresistens TaxID=1485586 RepID=A0A7W3XWB3_9ACTN|nr:hypothetical protein [Streptomyces calidiresistens]MBB0229895.1 hypothetical protein [Streptomyces calidiresistens]
MTTNEHSGAGEAVAAAQRAAQQWEDHPDRDMAGRLSCTDLAGRTGTIGAVAADEEGALLVWTGPAVGEPGLRIIDPTGTDTLTAAALAMAGETESAR